MVSIYFHIPYCVKKCPYCDFNTYAISIDPKVKLEEEIYISSLIKEFYQKIELLNWKNKTCRSIFIGGGTPSLLAPASIKKLIDAVKSTLSFVANIEITMEANPGTVQEEVGKEKFGGFKAAGVNRISLGVQSFSPKKLQELGRIHSAEDVPKAVTNLKEAGFENFNLDLMFGIAGESLNEWESDIETALALSPTHLSSYGLTIEPGTIFSKEEKKGAIKTVDEEISAQMYEILVEKTRAAGFLRYEISNFSKPRFECVHNIGYWNGREYLGLGAGAHSYTKQDNSWGDRWSNIPGPSDYIKRIEETGNASQLKEALTIDQAKLEFLSLGLRKTEGISKTKYERLFNEPFPLTLNKMIQDGLIIKDRDQLYLSDKGFLFANSVFEEL